MKARAQSLRSAEVSRIQDELERNSFPRLQMSLLVALTGGSGFFTSFLLLRAGVVEMWLRYLMSFAAAYAIFLLLLWVWMKTRADQDDHQGPDPGPDPDPALVEVSWSGGDRPAAAGYRGKGGTFDGGGASATFETSTKPVRAVNQGRRAGGKSSGAEGESEGFVLALIIILLIAAVLLSSLFFVISSAPALFAELMVDGVLSASLFRKLKGVETRHWLATALRKTALPFGLTAVVVCGCGWAMARIAPGAHSIGQVFAQIS